SMTAETPALTETILERKGCPIHYWLGGPTDRPLVVFTHGACVDHRSFDPILPTVARTYRVLAWDVRGHGLSQPAATPFSVPLAVEDLLAILDSLGVQQVVMVGHSNGTYIAQEMAFRHPERVLALVIADGTDILLPRSAFDNWLLRVSADMMALFPYETLKKSSLPYLSANKAVQDYAYAAYSMLSKEAFITNWRGVSACTHAEPGYTIQQPLLLVHGDQDKMGDILKIAPAWAARTPNCQYVTLPNARHFAILDDPQQFTALLMDFLQKWVPAG
ncbi:MAG TPA: alpha/beta hydrolase, partial [Chloroflexota bacterium]|nr:alpha/beta hydrolase [Chloroflexota bacterium]